MTNNSPPDESLQKQPGQSGNFPIVGLGASAGGLKALLLFFEQLPDDSGMAFVVILHLSPTHESHAVEVLQKATSMPVSQVTETVRVEPNSVYVIPPTMNLSLMDGHIEPSEPDTTGARHVAIDLFFRTLADVHKEKAFCVVLSGTGSDGSTGIRRIKEQGGIVIAQDPENAEYDTMPRNAIATGMVDFVLPVAEIPNKLIQIWRNAHQIKLPSVAEPTQVVDTSKAAEEALSQILTLLRARTGHDFTYYKRATVLRRIERRLQVNQLPDLPAYRDYLRSHTDETHALFKDMLISVTNFFRDREAFETLERDVIPHLFEGKTSNDQVRVWTAGCATGEEAYSLAILLCEHAETLSQSPIIQVFATEIDEDMILTAREGLFPESIVTDVSPARLRNYFLKESGGYRVKKNIREKVLYAVHNLTKDPPFSKLDLVSCRNLLIYLNRDMQEQVLELFHFALKPGGYLFLGGSESADGATDLFTVLDKKQRIFQSKMISRLARVPSLPLGTMLRKPPAHTEETPDERRGSFGNLHQKLVQQYAPPSVLINHEYEIVHLSDRAGRFLQFVGGEPSHNLLKTVIPELRLELRTALFQAIKTQKSIEARRVKLIRDDRTYYVNMIVRPVHDDATRSDFILVLFAEVEDTVGMEGKEWHSGESEPVVQQLEEELQRTKEQLRTTIEQYETSTEEMKASNEELQAINEELRSTTEELETSKEELQSINEELTTVNQELKNKVEEISNINDDLQNLIASTDIATIFLDRSLRIKRFTPRAQEIFNLIPTDIGRSLLDITHQLKNQQLQKDAEAVFSSLSTIEREVQSLDGRWYIARWLPYRTLNDRIDGAVLTFVDITELKQAEESLRSSETRLKLSLSSANAGWWDYDFRTRSFYLSDELYKLFGLDPRTRLEELMTGVNFIHSEDREHVLTKITSTIEHESNLDLEFRPALQFDNVRWLHAIGKIFFSAENQPLRMTGIVVDVTERKQVEESLLQSEAKLLVARDSLEKEIHDRTSELEQSNEALKIEVAERKVAETQIKNLLRLLIGTQENERKRISLDLHDRLGQRLTALRLTLEALKNESQGQSDLTRKIAELQQLAIQLDEETELLVWEVRPSILDELGLNSAVRNYLEGWKKNSGIEIEFQYTGLEQERPTAEIETTLYRILQESLNNVMKHSQANHVSVILERRADNIALIIEDNGIGFEQDENNNFETPEKGLGLLGIRERASLVGGTVEIESAPGEGTTVFVKLPFALPGKGE